MENVDYRIKVRLRSWPSPQDYNEALQVPLSTLNDAELQTGEAECNSHGIPRPVSGMFASVYRLKCEKKDWAVRCFLHDVPDQHERYEKIEEHLGRCDLPFFVPFDFQKEGIQIHDTAYPILKMEWCTGKTLDAYISDLIAGEGVEADGIPADSAAAKAACLTELAENWAHMIADLRENGIAHGDLQHGNVLIEGNRFRLVDYDGMFVPGLEGRACSELGHRNYQHPNRRAEDFNSNLDNFSSWVVYVSLKCLAIAPSLFDRSRGNECLLWQREDFLQPEKSTLVRKLETHSSSELRLYSRWIRYLVSLPPNTVPALDPELNFGQYDLPEAPEVWWAALAANQEVDPGTQLYSASVRTHSDEPKDSILLRNLLRVIGSLLTLVGLLFLFSLFTSLASITPSNDGQGSVAPLSIVRNDQYAENALYREAMSAYERNDFAQAQACFEKFLSSVPASPAMVSTLEARLRLGKLYLNAGKLADGWKVYADGVEGLEATLSNEEKAVAYPLCINLAALAQDIGDRSLKEEYAKRSEGFTDEPYYAYHRAYDLFGNVINSDVCRAEDGLGWERNAVVSERQKMLYRRGVQNPLASFMAFAQVRAATPDSPKSDYYIATVDEQLGYAYYTAGLPDRAIAALENAAKNFTYLMENEPFNRFPIEGVRKRQGKVLVKLASALEFRAVKSSARRTEDSSRAKAMFQKAVDLLGEQEAQGLKREGQFPEPDQTPYNGSYESFKADTYYSAKTGT